MNLDNASILITGGTGSFGRAFLKHLLQYHPKIKRIVIYSRDEQKQFEIQQKYIGTEYSHLRFFLGDIRDKDRLERAFEGIDYVIHAAALKQVPAAEFNPFECIKTNILGAENIIDASITCKVKKVLAISTDKAVAPINLYGATKLCSDKLFIAANNYVGDKNILFSVIRYGNVLGSRASVIPHFLNIKKKGSFPITDIEMTRFGITLEEETNFALFALENMWGGEVFVKKSPSFKVIDIAKAIDPNLERHIIGIRPGEKLHEEMLTKDDALNTIECDEYFTILPTIRKWNVKKYMTHFNGRKCQNNFVYNSANNTDWLSISDLQKFITDYKEYQL